MHRQLKIALIFASLAFVFFASQLAIAAASGPCIKNYTVKGSFFTEKKYSTWQKFPDVSTQAAFKPAYLYIVKAGWTINQSDT